MGSVLYGFSITSHNGKYNICGTVEDLDDLDYLDDLSVDELSV